VGGAAGLARALLAQALLRREAVGERYWPACLATINRLLPPGGRTGRQATTSIHRAPTSFC